MKLISAIFGVAGITSNNECQINDSQISQTFMETMATFLVNFRNPRLLKLLSYVSATCTENQAISWNSSQSFKHWGCLRADQRTTLTWKISVSQFEEVLKFRWFCGMFPSWKRESVADRNVVSNNRIWWKPVLQTQSHSLLKIDSSWCISCCLCAIPLLAVKNKNIHNWFSSD